MSYLGSARLGTPRRVSGPRWGGHIFRRLLTLLVAGIVALMTGAPALAGPVATPAGGAAAPAVKAAAVPASLNAPTIPTDPTKVPHYFGPYPNWANTPQVLSDAIVTFSNGGGTGAEGKATVDPKTGAISAITVTSPGSGYTTVPDVAITAAGVTPAPAAATAAISSGVVTSIAVNEAGFGFTAPAVTLTGGNPTTGSEATAVASGGVDNLTLTDPGSGYATQPLVTVSLPDLPSGVQATATATMDANGVVTSITVADKGSGYTKAPTVTIADAGLLNPTKGLR